MRLLALACVLACLAPEARGQSASAPWQMKRFPISIWSGGGDDAYMGILAAAGFTVVMTREEYLPACGRNGLKAILMPPKGEAIPPETARRLANHPTVIGFFFHDEPTAEVIAQRAEAYRALRQAAPNKLIYVNLASSPSARAALLRELRPQVLSYDWYQWWYGSPGDEGKRQWNLYGSLATHQDAARQAGIPLWVWVEASAHSGAGRGVKGAFQGDNLVCLRQSVYSNLAGGARAIQWFNDRLIFNQDYTALSPRGQDVAAINLEVRRLADALVPLAFSHTIHTGHCATKPAAEAPVRTPTNNLLIGVFTAPGKEMTRQAILLVVNKDIHKAAQARLEFPRAPRSLRRLGKADGAWGSLPNQAWASLPLEPGSGELIEVNW